MPAFFCVILFLLTTYRIPISRALGDSPDENFFKLCPPTRCSNSGPKIRFPFRHNTQPSFCGLQGSELSCSGDNTLIHLPFSGEYYVKEISYRDRQIYVTEVNGTKCPIQSSLSFNNSGSILDGSNISRNTFSFVNCTERVETDEMIGPIDCLQNDNNLVYIADGRFSMDRLPRTCGRFKDAEIAIGSGSARPAIERILRTGEILDGWTAPTGCYDCARSREYCWFNSTKSDKAICYSFRHRSSRGPTIIGTSIGGIVLLAVVIFVVYRCRKSDNEKEIGLKIEKFLANYKALTPTRYTFSDIKKITGRFRHKLGQGGYGSVYQGKLPNGVPVAVKVLENSKGNGDEFVNEVATISRIHHFNVVRLLGFCYEGTQRALVFEFVLNGSLEKFIFSKDAKSSHWPFSWETLHQIAIGIARGIEYLHQGCNQRILHFDIKPHNILLDQNFQPKISDFGLAKLCSKDRSIVSLTAARGTAGYIAPELFSRNFGEVSYKSDVYSFGILLLEMVECKKKIDVTVENQSQIFFLEWIYDRISQGIELDLQVEMDGDEEIAKKLTIVSLWCIQWSPKDRPSMTMVVQMLEGDLVNLEIPPKPFVSSDIGRVQLDVQ